MCRRAGVGKTRHWDTRSVWIQELVRDQVRDVDRVAGDEIPVDLLTKHLGGELISAHLSRMSCWEPVGRALLAPGCT